MNKVKLVESGCLDVILPLLSTQSPFVQFKVLGTLRMLLMGQCKFTLYNLSSTWYTTSYMMTDTLNLLKKEWLWSCLRHWIVWWRGYSIFSSNFWCPFRQCPGNLFVSRKLFLHLRFKFSPFVYLGFTVVLYHVYVWMSFIVSYSVFRTRTTVL